MEELRSAINLYGTARKGKESAKKFLRSKREGQRERKREGREKKEETQTSPTKVFFFFISIQSIFLFVYFLHNRRDAMKVNLR